MASRSRPEHRRHTIAGYERLPEEEGCRVELVRGALVREPAPGYPHGRVAGILGALLGHYLREHGLGAYLPETGFVLSTDPPTVRIPDIAVVVRSRLPDDRRQSGFLGGAPDLAVEILSPSNTASGIREKVHDFLSAGTRLVWVVDPETERVFRYRPQEPPRVLAGDDVLDAGPVLPGFRVPVARIFE